MDQERSAAPGGENVPEIMQPADPAPEDTAPAAETVEDLTPDIASAGQESVSDIQSAVAEEKARLVGEQEKTVRQRAQMVAREQVREISALDGDIQSLEDLMDMPEYDGFYALVKKGVSLVEAYKLARYDKLMKRAADAAARQTMRSLDSRRHLTALAGQPGAGEYVSVPAEVAAEYRLAKPGITDEEIRRKYRKYQKYQRQ